MVAAPLGLAVAVQRRRASSVTVVAAVVVTVGAAGVVNDSTAPNVVPSAFEAIAQK